MHNKTFVTIALVARRIRPVVLHSVVGVALGAIERSVPWPGTAKVGVRTAKRTEVRPAFAHKFILHRLVEGRNPCSRSRTSNAIGQ